MAIYGGMNQAPIQLLPEHLKLVGEIDEFKGRWNAVASLAPEQLAELRTATIIESVGSSTRIEGSRLTNIEVRALLSGLKLGKLKTRDQQEVAGYADAANRVYEQWTSIDVSESTIRELHRQLLKFSSKDLRHAGAYKSTPNHIEAFDGEGKSLGVVLETVPPADTPAAMADLVAQYHAHIVSDTHHPLLVVAIFTLQFLAIHPFADGNGRLSRILTNLLLLKAGYAYVPYCSLEKIIEDNKDRYYLALRQAQETLNTDNGQLHLWLSFFLSALKQQVDVLKGRIAADHLLQGLPPLSRDVLLLARTRKRITVREAVQATAANRNTVKAHLHDLQRRGLLTQHGVRKGTWYEPA